MGQRTGLAAEILGGVQVGEVVIVHPDETVEEGKELAVTRR